MKTLNLTFKGSLGKNHVMKVYNAKDNLQKDPVLAAMKEISALKMFKHDDEFIYEQPVAAKYVDTNEEVIFDLTAKAKQLELDV